MKEMENGWYRQTITKIAMKRTDNLMKVEIEKRETETK